MRTDRIAQGIILSGMLVLMVLAVGIPQSADFRAVWLAGAFYEAGAVYTGSGGLFTMEPPRVWVDHVLAQGVETPVYPFIYPPLWAWVSAQVVPFFAFEQAVFGVTVVNLLLFATMPVLAFRIARPEVSLTTFLLVSVPLFGFTYPFLIPLEENQPQILVSFLILLAVERSRNGGPLVAGAAMALAASIKLYPAVFALFWLLSGERRAFAAFVLIGGALGAASIFVAGWPMHEAFLNEIKAISNSALYSTSNYSFDPFYAKLALAEDMVRISSEETGGDSIWKVVEKTQAWRLVNMTLFASAVFFLARAAVRGQAQTAFFWPAAFLVLALVSPLTWLYHLIPALVFLPALFFTALPRLLSVVLYVSFIFLMRANGAFAELGLSLALPGTHELIFFTLLLLACAFLLLSSDRANRPLNPPAQSL